MNLEIENKSDIQLDEYISQTLMPSMQKTFISHIDDRLLVKFDKYLTDVYSQYVNGIISTRKLIIDCIYNLIYNKTDSTYIIEINPNTKIDTIDVKHIDIARLVNYGNMQLSSYPIFTDLFDYYAQVFPDMFKRYYNELEV